MWPVPFSGFAVTGDAIRYLEFAMLQLGVAVLRCIAESLTRQGYRGAVTQIHRDLVLMLELRCSLTCPFRCQILIISVSTLVNFAFQPDVSFDMF